ncbi:hypothetical protein WDU94_010582 [Cyamophila willieti]
MAFNNFLLCILLVRSTNVITAQEPPQNGGQLPKSISNDNSPTNSAAFSAGIPPKSPVESQLNAPPLSFLDNAGSNGQNYPFFGQAGFGQGFGQSGQYQNQFSPASQQSNGQLYSESVKFGPPGLQIQNHFGPPNQQIPNGPPFQMNPASNGQPSSQHFKFGSQSQQMPPRFASQFGSPGLGMPFGPGSQQMSSSQMSSTFGASGQQVGSSFGGSVQPMPSPSVQQPFQSATVEGQGNQKYVPSNPANYQMSGAGNFMPPDQMIHQRAGEQTFGNNLMTNGGEATPPNQIMPNPGEAMSPYQMSNGGGFMPPSHPNFGPSNFQMPGSGAFGPPIPSNNFMANSGGFLPPNPQMPGTGGFMPSFASIASAVIPSLMYMTTPGILFPSTPLLMQHPLNIYGQGPKPPHFPFGQYGGMNGGLNTMPGTPGGGFNFQRPFNTMPSGNGFNFQRPFTGQLGSNFPGFPRPQMFPLGGQMNQMFNPYQQGTGPNNPVPNGPYNAGSNGVSGENGPNGSYYILQNNSNNGPKRDDKPAEVGAQQIGTNSNNKEGMAPSMNVIPNGTALQGPQPVPSITQEVNSPKDNQISSTPAIADLNPTKAISSGALQIDAPPNVETNHVMSEPNVKMAGGVETNQGNISGKAVATERDGIPDDLVVPNEASSQHGSSGVLNGQGNINTGGTSIGQGNVGGGTGGANIAAIPATSLQVQAGKHLERPQGTIGQNSGSLYQSGLTAIGGDTDGSLVGEGGELAAGGGQLGVGGHSAAGGGQLGVGGGHSTGGSSGGGIGGPSGGQQIKLVTMPAKKTQTITLQTVGSPSTSNMKQGGASNIKLITLPTQGKFMQQDGSSVVMQHGGGSTSGATGIRYPGNAARLSKYQMYPNSFLVTPIQTKLPRPSHHGNILNENFDMEDIINPMDQTLSSQNQANARKVKIDLRPNKTNMATRNENEKNFRK